MEEPRVPERMRRQRSTDRPTAAGPPAGSPGRTTPTTEDVLLRNHDFQWGYDVELVAERVADGTAFRKRYYLQPGATRRELGVLEPGEYAVRVRLDGDREGSGRCRIGDDPDATVLVELGNGAVSVHEGLYR